MFERVRTLTLAVALLSAASAGAQAQEAPKPVAADPGILRICASEKENPFSMTDGKGFENRIGVVVAAAMGRKPVFVWTTKPAVYLVRDFLDENLCDVVMGIDTGDERVLSSKPYYRSGYVFITKADVIVNSWRDDSVRRMVRFAISFSSPAEVMLRTGGKWENNLAYLMSLVNFKDSRNQYTRLDPARIVTEVAQGHAELGVAFSPEVARYVKESPVPLRVTLIPDDNTRSDGMRIPHHFSQSIGVRRDDRQLLEAVDKAIAKAKAEIDQVLADEGILMLPTGS